MALRKGVFRVLLVPLARAVAVKSARREAWRSIVAAGVFSKVCFFALVRKVGNLND